MSKCVRVRSLHTFFSLLIVEMRLIVFGAILLWIYWNISAFEPHPESFSFYSHRFAKIRLWFSDCCSSIFKPIIVTVFLIIFNQFGFFFSLNVLRCCKRDTHTIDIVKPLKEKLLLLLLLLLQHWIFWRTIFFMHFFGIVHRNFHRINYFALEYTIEQSQRIHIIAVSGMIFILTNKLPIVWPMWDLHTSSWCTVPK